MTEATRRRVSPVRSAVRATATCHERGITMRTRIASRWPLVAAVLVLPLAPNAGAAQLVVPRTVPVQQSGQFDLFPSQRASMAGASIALDDTLLDPFVNPAKTTRLRL